MNRYPIQCLRNYPLSPYLLRFEREFYDKHTNLESTIVFKRTYRASKMISEKIIDHRYVLRKKNGDILCFYNINEYYYNRI